MLQEFRVDNFKSLINIVFKPHEINLLLGKNNSGKTNLCQALQFVGATSLFKLDECADGIAGGRFGMTNFAFDKSTIDFYLRAKVPYEEEALAFEYELTISPPKDGMGEIRVDREVLTVTGGKFEQTILLENISGRIRLLHEKDFMDGIENYVETNASVDTTMLNRLYDSETNARANHFKRYLGNWICYDLSPNAMRESDYKPSEVFLNSDGSNLASVLYWLKTQNERDYRKLMKVMQVIEPKFDIINFPVGSESVVVMLFEDSDGHSLPAWNASNGTLRFLALTYVLLIQTQLILDSRPLLMIEEPENGIYVGFLKTLLEMVDQSHGPQVIFTSHAPYFIDLFDEYLDGVFVLNCGKQHTSIIQPDSTKVKKWLLEAFPLGEQHFREMLG